MLRAVSGTDAPNDINVSLSTVKSFVFAPVIGHEMGMPFLSVERLRLVPSLALSVGFLPISPPTEGCLGHRPVGGAKAPVDTLQFVVLVQQVLPYLFEYAPMLPFLEPAVRRA